MNSPEKEINLSINQDSVFIIPINNKYSYRKFNLLNRYIYAN